MFAAVMGSDADVTWFETLLLGRSQGHTLGTACTFECSAPNARVGRVGGIDTS